MDFSIHRDWSANEKSHANCLRYVSGKSLSMKSIRMHCASAHETIAARNYTPTLVLFWAKAILKTTFERILVIVCKKHIKWCQNSGMAKRQEKNDDDDIETNRNTAPLKQFKNKSNRENYIDGEESDKILCNICTKATTTASTTKIVNKTKWQNWEENMWNKEKKR